MIIQALPSVGKSSAAQRRTDFVDGDDLLAAVMGDATKVEVDALFASTERQVELKELIAAAVADGKHILTNLDYSSFGFKPDIVVAYTADDYIEHIRRAKRDDLFEFGEAELRRWAESASEKRPVLLLRADQYLLAALAILKL